MRGKYKRAGHTHNQWSKHQSSCNRWDHRMRSQKVPHWGSDTRYWEGAVRQRKEPARRERRTPAAESDRPKNSDMPHVQVWQYSLQAHQGLLVQKEGGNKAPSDSCFPSALWKYWTTEAVWPQTENDKQILSVALLLTQDELFCCSQWLQNTVCIVQQC